LLLNACSARFWSFWPRGRDHRSACRDTAAVRALPPVHALNRCQRCCLPESLSPAIPFRAAAGCIHLGPPCSRCACACIGAPRLPACVLCRVLGQRRGAHLAARFAYRVVTRAYPAARCVEGVDLGSQWRLDVPPPRLSPLLDADEPRSGWPLLVRSIRQAVEAMSMAPPR
jgi:hypothetical protein